MKAVVDTYRIVQPYFLVTSTEAELWDEAYKFAQKFLDAISPLFQSQLLFVQSAFISKLDHLTDVKQLANLLLIENSSLASRYSDFIMLV